MENNVSNTGGNFGRLSYFDPNTLIYENKQGTNSDSITFPYEDYSMAVDLIIREYNRYSCGLSNVTGEYKDYYYSTSDGTISFLGGTKLKDGESGETEGYNYLTTRYTDVSMTDPVDNTQECLGIESIDITYQSWFHPQVTIKFIDVRGATVMLQAENAYYNPSELGSNSHLYKAFFSFPYPLFILKVKGFYGKGVTYKLAISETTIDFDAGTGNFIITAKFIGHMYGIFADIPMNYIAIAPYTTEGSSYWQSKIEDNTFCFRGQGDTIQSPMVTFPRLRVMIENAKNSPEYLSLTEDAEETEENINSQIESTNDIITKYNEIFGNDSSFECDSAPGVIFKMAGSVDDKEFEKKVDEFFNALSAHDSTYETNFLSEFGGGDKIKKEVGDKRNNCVRFHAERRGSGYTSYNEYRFFGYDSSKYLAKKYIENKEDVLRQIDKKRNGLTSFNVYVFEKGTDKKYEDIVYKGLNDSLKELGERRELKKQEYNKKKDEAIERALGFTPSIRNIYELVFAHMDTFLETFYASMKTIKRQLESKSVERQKTHYPEVTDELTDTEARINKAGTIVGPPRSHYLPPYTAFYKENRDPTKTDTNGQIMKKVLRWPGELINSGDLDEVDFIEEMINASKMYFEDNAIVDRMLSVSGDSGQMFTLASDVTRFIPLTIYDLVHNGSMENPYTQVRRSLSKNSDDITGRIFFILAMRAFYYCATNPGNKDAYTFGKVEAVNFFKAVGENISQKFFEFIKKYADGSNENREKSEFIDIITGNYAFNENAKKTASTWLDSNAPNIGNSLFKNSGFDLVYSYCKRGENKLTYFPLRVVDPDKVKADLATGDELAHKRGYISTTSKYSFIGDPSSFMVGKELEGGSFLVIEDRDHFKNILDNFKKAIDESKVALENRDKEKGYGNADVGDFAGLREKDFNRIADNVVSKRGDCFYRKWCIVSEDGNDDGRRGLKKLMQTGTTSDFKRYYIKNPAVVNDNEKSSIFTDGLYKQQTNIVAKACIFVQAIPLLGHNAGLDEKSENGVTAKTVLLREGALVWMHNHMDEMNFSGYRKPATGHWLGSNSLMTLLPLVEDCFETYRPIKFGALDDAVGLNLYMPYVYPEGTNDARKTYLEQYFVHWAQTEYSTLESLLLDKSLYVDNDYEKGLNVEHMIQSKATNESGENMKRVQDLLRGLFFQMCTVVDYYNGSDNSKSYLSCNRNNMSKVFDGFMVQLRKIYGETADDLEDNPDEMQRKIAQGKLNDPFKNTDLKLSTYMTVKNIYDRWISGLYHGEETYRFRRRKGTNYELDNFIYCDNFFHDIGDTLKINMTTVGDWLAKIIPSSEVVGEEGELKFKSQSIYEFLAEVAQSVTAYLMAIPQRMMYLDKQSIEDAFRPIPTCQDWDDDTSTYMVLYTYKPSEHLGSTEASNIDMNGWSPDGDGFNLTDEEIVGTLFNDDGTVVPAFGVTFAKQNQAYFKNISLTSKSPGVTEVGIANTMNIASKAGEEVRNTTLYGQDIYRVYSNYAYECTVEMMGCMQIFPPMYFQLNNVPMWKGAYMIQKVSHSIRPGNITTTFSGVRQNKYAIPMSDSNIVGFVPQAGPSTANTAGTPAANVTESQIDQGGVGGTSDKQVTGQRDKVIPNINNDFKDENVTPLKPLICLLPAHSPYDGPRIQKSKECAWSQKLIDNYIIPKLNRLTFKDGTSFADNVHRCKTSEDKSGGYSAREIINLVSKFGSDCVISLAPHWNGCGGKYLAVFDGKQIGTKTKDWWTDPRNPRFRSDSATFAAYMREAGKKLTQRYNSGEFKLIPNGMMDQGVKSTHLLYTASYENDRTDPAVNPDCACILTENWFADYMVPNSPNWSSSRYLEMGSDGRYQNGRAWLESEEGLNAISDMHVDGIYNYINNLTGSKPSPSNPSSYNDTSDKEYVYTGDGTKNVADLITYCRAQLGKPYWWGGIGELATEELYWKKRNLFGCDIYCRTDPPYLTQLGKKVHDCVGLIKGYMWSSSPTDPSPKYNSNNFKDTTSDALLARSTVKGPISKMPDVPGLAVFMSGHVGVYVGNGKVIEAKGHAYGVVETNLAGRGWTHWAYIDGIKYT